MRRRVLERALQRRVADQQLRVGLLAERHGSRRSGSSTFVSTTEVALSGVTATERTRPSGMRVTSWIESTAPSDETQSARQEPQRGRRCRAYSIDEIGAMSISPSSSSAVQLGRNAR